MSILKETDVEMKETTATKAKKGKKGVKDGKKGVKDASVKAAVSALAEKGKKGKKAKKPAVLAPKKTTMNETKVLKNQIWMKSVKELSGRKNLTPIHQEVLQKIVGRTCLPQHPEKFLTFVEKCLKFKREKYGTALEELFNMLKKIYKNHTQAAGIRKVSEAETKAKKEAKKSKDKSELSKSQKKRLKRKERRKLAQARDGVLQPSKVEKGKKKKPAQPKKTAQSPAKKVAAAAAPKPKNVKNSNVKKENKKKGKPNVKKEVKMEVDS